jgi:nitroreductase
MTGASSDVWEVMSTARTIRRFTDEPVDNVTLARCLEAARWAPSGANAQGWRFVVLRFRRDRRWREEVRVTCTLASISLSETANWRRSVRTSMSMN